MARVHSRVEHVIELLRFCDYVCIRSMSTTVVVCVYACVCVSDLTKIVLVVLHTLLVYNYV